MQSSGMVMIMIHVCVWSWQVAAAELPALQAELDESAATLEAAVLRVQAAEEEAAGAGAEEVLAGLFEQIRTGAHGFDVFERRQRL